MVGPLGVARGTEQLSSCGVLLWLCQSHQMMQLSCLPVSKRNESLIPQEGMHERSEVGDPHLEIHRGDKARGWIFHLSCCLFYAQSEFSTPGWFLPRVRWHQPLWDCFVEEMQHPLEINDLWLDGCGGQEMLCGWDFSEKL